MAKTKIAVPIIVAVAIASAIAIYMLGPIGPAQATEVKIGTLRGACGISYFEVADVLEIDQRYGLEVTMVPFEGVPLILEGLIKGELDLAIIPVEFLYRALSSGNVKVIGLDVLQYQAIVSREPISDLSDLIGKKIGVFKPTATYIELKIYLAELGYQYSEEEFEEDKINIVNAPPATVLESLRKGEIDAAALLGPQVVVAQDIVQGSVITYIDLWDRIGGEGPPPLIVIVTSVKKANTIGDVINRIIELRSEAVDAWRNNPDVVDKLYVDVCGLERRYAEEFNNWMKNYIWPKSMDDEEALRGMAFMMSLLRKHGFIGGDEELYSLLVNNLYRVG